MFHQSLICQQIFALRPTELQLEVGMKISVGGGWGEAKLFSSSSSPPHFFLSFETPTGSPAKAAESDLTVAPLPKM